MYKISDNVDYIIINTGYTNRLINYKIPYDELDHKFTVVGDNNKVLIGEKIPNTLLFNFKDLTNCVIFHKNDDDILDIGKLNYYTNILGKIGYCAFCNSENIYQMELHEISEKKVLYAFVDTENG